MSFDLGKFIHELDADPRQHVTRRLLEAIAALWQDEERITRFELDFHVSTALDAEPIITLATYGKNARDDFREFARLNVFTSSPTELAPEDELKIARLGVAAAQRDVVRAMERVREAQERLADAHGKAATDIDAAGGELA